MDDNKSVGPSLVVPEVVAGDISQPGLQNGVVLHDAEDLVAETGSLFTPQVIVDPSGRPVKLRIRKYVLPGLAVIGVLTLFIGSMSLYAWKNASRNSEQLPEVLQSQPPNNLTDLGASGLGPDAKLGITVTSEFSQDVAIKGALTVSGDTIIQGNVLAQSNFTLNGTLTVTGDTAISGRISAEDLQTTTLLAQLISAKKIVGDGADLDNLNANKITQGVLTDTRLSANVAFLNGNQTFTGQNTYTQTVTLQSSLVATTAAFTGVVSGAIAVSANDFVTLSQATGLVTSGTSNAFIQGGNSFGVPAVLGTSDAQSLVLQTNGVNRVTIDAAGATAIAGNTSITGNTTVTGNGTVTGSATLGTNSSNNVTVNGVATFAANRPPSTTPVSNSGLVLDLSFEEGSGTTTSDASGNNNNAYVPGGTTPAATAPDWTTDKKFGNYALNFDGNTDFLQIDDNSTLDFTTAFTMEAWVNFGDAKVWQPIFSKRNANHSGAIVDSAYNMFRTIDTLGSKLYISVSNPPGTSAPSLMGNTTLQSNRWYHVAATYDGTTVRLYVDGKLDGSMAFSGALFDSPAPVYIAGTKDQLGIVGQPFGKYKMDNAKMYNRSLSESELNNEYLTGANGVALGVTSGNVGIGTLTPRGLLDIQGDNSEVYLQSNPVSLDGERKNSPVLTLNGTFDSDTSGAVANATAQATIQTILTTGGLTPDFRLSLQAGGTQRGLNILNNGRVGIGTTTPQNALTIGTLGTLASDLSSVVIVTTAPTTGGTLTAGTYFYKLVIVDTNGGLTEVSQEHSCTVDGTTTNACTLIFSGGAGKVYRLYKGISANGQTGYFTITPTISTVTYVDTGAATTAGTPPSVTTAYTYRLSGTTTSYIHTYFGGLGVGTATPTATLHVAGYQPLDVATNGSTLGNAFTVAGAKGGNTTGTTAQLAANGAAIALTTGAGGNAPSGSTNGNGGLLTLQTGAAGSGAGTAGRYGFLTLQSSGGNTGIGTSSPAAKLHVTGATTFTGTGTVTTVGTTVTGTGTSFNTQLTVGDTIIISGQVRTVIAIASATSLTVHSTFSSDIAVATSFTYVQPLTKLATSASQVGLSLQSAASQTANIFEIKNSSGTPIFYSRPDNHLVIAGSTNLNFSNVDPTGFSMPNKLFIQPTGTTTNVVGIRGAVSQTGDLLQLQNSAGTVLSNFNASGNLGLGTITSPNKLTINSATTSDSVAQALISTGASTNKGLVVQSVASQTADLLQFQNSAGTNLLSVTATGVVSAINNTSGLIFNTSTASSNTVDFFSGDGGSRLRLADSGLYAVGTTSARTNGISTASGLRVAGDGGTVVLQAGNTASSANLQVGAGNSAGTSNAVGGNFTLYGGAGTGTGVGGNIIFGYYPASGVSGSTVNTIQTACTISGTNGSFSCPGSGASSERFGLNSVASASNDAVFGQGASSGTGGTGVVIGGSATTTGGGIRKVVIGFGATSTSGDGVTVVGAQASGAGDNSIVIGRGSSTSAAHTGSIALGFSTATTAANQLVIGSSSLVAYAISDVYIGNGVTHATPVGFTLNATGGSGTNIAGSNLSLAAGKATGSAAGGDINFQTSDVGASGTTAQSLTNKLIIKSGGQVRILSGRFQVARTDQADLNTATLFATPSYSSNGSVSFQDQAATTLPLATGAVWSAGGGSSYRYELGPNYLSAFTAGTQRMYVDSSGRFVLGSTTATGTNTRLQINPFNTVDNLATAQVNTNAATNKGLVVQGFAAQSGDLFQAQDSTGTVLASIDFAGNLTVKNATFNGTLSVNGHIITGNTSGTTTIAAGAAACTTPTVSISGNDTAGTITITTGTGCASTGILGTITFAAAYGAAPRVVVSADNANASALATYTANRTTTTFTLDTNTTPTDTTTYTFNYFIAQ